MQVEMKEFDLKASLIKSMHFLIRIIYVPIERDISLACRPFPQYLSLENDAKPIRHMGTDPRRQEWAPKK